MKILHVYKKYFPYSVGGIESHIFNLSEALHDLGIQSTILATSPRKKMSDHQIGRSKAYLFPTSIEWASCPISIGLLKNFKNIAQEFDVIHYYFPWPFADLMHLMSKIKKPTVVSYHSDIVRQKYLKWIYFPFMHSFLQKADAVITSSQIYSDTSIVLGKYRHKNSIIPIGLDQIHYPIPSESEIQTWRQRVGENFFLFLGTLRYYKGLNFLLEAARGTNLRIVIAGSGGSEEEKLKKLKEKYHLDQVTFVGHIDEIAKAALFKLCKASIMTSHLRSESFSVSLVESFMFGKPAISTEINTGTSFVNQHNISGLIVPPQNPQALRQAMQLMSTDSQLYQQLQNGALSRYTEYFSAQTMAQKYLEIYQKLL